LATLGVIDAEDDGAMEGSRAFARLGVGMGAGCPTGADGRIAIGATGLASCVDAVGVTVAGGSLLSVIAPAAGFAEATASVAVTCSSVVAGAAVTVAAATADPRGLAATPPLASSAAGDDGAASVVVAAGAIFTIGAAAG
jgi:hypothetical protein